MSLILPLPLKSTDLFNNFIMLACWILLNTSSSTVALRSSITLALPGLKIVSVVASIPFSGKSAIARLALNFKTFSDSLANSVRPLMKALPCAFALRPSLVLLKSATRSRKSFGFRFGCTLFKLNMVFLTSSPLLPPVLS